MKITDAHNEGESYKKMARRDVSSLHDLPKTSWLTGIFEIQLSS